MNQNGIFKPIEFEGFNYGESATIKKISYGKE